MISIIATGYIDRNNAIYVNLKYKLFHALIKNV